MSYFSIEMHFVFATKNRASLIQPEWRPRLYSYMAGVFRNKKALVREVGGVDDHVHMLASLRGNHAPADLMRDVKAESSSWVHDELREPSFEWQEGYGCFSVSSSNIDAVTDYIRRQEEHHRRRSFRDEYRELLVRHGIPFDERFLP